MMKLSKDKLILSILIILSEIVIEFCVDNFLPSTPFIAKSLYVGVSVIESSFLGTFVGAALGMLIAGVLLINNKRKKICLYSFILLIIGELISLVAFNQSIFFISRFLSGFAIGMIGNSFMAILTDSLTGSEFTKVNAVFMLVLGVMPIVSPMAGGVIETYLGWRFNFLIPVILLLIVIICFKFFYNETFSPEVSEKKSLSKLTYEFFYPLCSIKLLTVIFIGIMVTSTFYAYSAIGPALFEVTFKLSPIEYASLSIFYTIAFVASSTFNAMLVDKIGLRKIMFIGGIIGVVGVVVLFAFSCFGYFSLIVIIVPICIYFFGISFVYDNALPLAMDITKVKVGNPAVLYIFMVTAASTVIGFISVYLPTGNIFSLSLLFLVLAVLAFLLLLFIIFKKYNTNASDN